MPDNEEVDQKPDVKPEKITVTVRGTDGVGKTFSSQSDDQELKCLYRYTHSDQVYAQANSQIREGIYCLRGENLSRPPRYGTADSNL